MGGAKPPTTPPANGTPTESALTAIIKLQADHTVLLERLKASETAADARFKALEAVTAVQRSGNVEPQGPSFQAAAAQADSAGNRTVKISIGRRTESAVQKQIEEDHASAVLLQEQDASDNNGAASDEPFAIVKASPAKTGTLVVVLPDGAVAIPATISGYKRAIGDNWTPGHPMLFSEGSNGELSLLASGQLSSLLSTAGNRGRSLIVMQSPTKEILTGPIPPSTKQTVEAVLDKYRQIIRPSSRRASSAAAPGSSHGEAQSKRGKSATVNSASAESTRLQPAAQARGRQLASGTPARPLAKYRGRLSIMRQLAASAKTAATQHEEDLAAGSGEQEQRTTLKSQPSAPITKIKKKASAAGVAALAEAASMQHQVLPEDSAAASVEQDGQARRKRRHGKKSERERRSLNAAAEQAAAVKRAADDANALQAAEAEKADLTRRTAAAAAAKRVADLNAVGRADAGGGAPPLSDNEADSQGDADREEGPGANGGGVRQGEASQFATPSERSPTPTPTSSPLPRIGAESRAGALASPVAVPGSGAFRHQLPPQSADANDGGPLSPSDSAAAAAKPSAFVRKPVVTRSVSTGANAVSAGPSDNTAEADGALPARGGGRKSKGAN